FAELRNYGYEYPPSSSPFLGEIILHLRNGGLGDATGADDDVIVDPGGPAIRIGGGSGGTTRPDDVITDPGGPAIRVSAARVESVALEKSSRRARADRITITFDRELTFEPGAFELIPLGRSPRATAIHQRRWRWTSRTDDRRPRSRN